MKSKHHPLLKYTPLNNLANQTTCHYCFCVSVCLHLSAKVDKSPSISSSATKPLSLSVFLFQTKDNFRPSPGPSFSILSTRYCPAVA